MIVGLAGNIGSGKSWMQLHYTLEQVNFKRKRLVTNFALNLPAVKSYAAMKKYGWLAHIIDTKQYAIVDAVEDISSLLKYPDSVVALDEAGIFLNARDFAKTPKKLLMDLCQSRKSGTDLIWASQFDEQVDKQFRMLTQYWIHCDSYTMYDSAMKRPKLAYKYYSYFDATTYQQWLSNLKVRNSKLRTQFGFAFKTVQGPLTKADKFLFNCFDSFARLEQQKVNASEMSRVPINLNNSLKHTQISKPKQKPLIQLILAD